MTFQLTIAEGKEAGKEFVFDQSQVVIGRTADCDVILYDPGVSRKHARIFVQGKSYYVEDMGSSNGTKVNGSVVKKKQLADGDAVALGPVVFSFTSKVVEEMDTDPKAQDPAKAVAKQSTRIVSQDKVAPPRNRQRNKGVALLPAGASGESLAALSRNSTATMEAVRSRKSGDGLARPEVRQLARPEPRPPPVRREPRGAKLSAADRARIRRESGGLGGNVRIFWVEAGALARGFIYLVGTLLAIAGLGGLYYVAIREPDRAPPPYPEHAKLEGVPIEDSFGLGEGVTWQRPDMKVFDFEFTAPTRAVVILHFQSSDLSQGEVAITVNGADVGFAPADSLNAAERSHEIIIPAAVLKKGEANQVIFDNTRNPPAADPWRIWNAWVETALLPEIPVAMLKREAQASFDRGQLNFERKDVGAANRYEAWKEFRNAWLNLEAHPEPRPELYVLAREKMREAQQELDLTCSKLMLEVEGYINQRDWEKARSTLDHVKSYFPGNDQPCPFRAEAKRAQHDL